MGLLQRDYTKKTLRHYCKMTEREFMLVLQRLHGCGQAAAAVDELLLTCEERMTCGANVQSEFLFS